MNENKAKAYDAKHGKDAYHYRYTKHGQAQSKAYDNFFSQGAAKHKALKKKLTGSGDHKKVSFTPHSKSEERAFNKRFNSKTG